jgi:sulfoxide reductase heme-binding subunit YedZ
MWLYFVDTHLRLRRDSFGFGNYTGALAALIFALLLALSNDLSLRWLKIRRWKSLQRWTYAAVILTAAHAIAYQQVETRTLPFEAVLGIVLAIVSIIQLVGVLKTRQSP